MPGYVDDEISTGSAQALILTETGYTAVTCARVKGKKQKAQFENWANA
jgi:hypothetical protein